LKGRSHSSKSWQTARDASPRNSRPTSLPMKEARRKGWNQLAAHHGPLIECLWNEPADLLAICVDHRDRPLDGGGRPVLTEESVDGFKCIRDQQVVGIEGADDVAAAAGECTVVSVTKSAVRLRNHSHVREPTFTEELRRSVYGGRVLDDDLVVAERLCLQRRDASRTNGIPFFVNRTIEKRGRRRSRLRGDGISAERAAQLVPSRSRHKSFSRSSTDRKRVSDWLGPSTIVATHSQCSAQSSSNWSML
jgi:hypothetical protein